MRYLATLGIMAVIGLMTLTTNVWAQSHPPYQCDLIGTANADTILGTNCWDWIEGRGGNDWIEGREGNDLIQGGPGLDSMWGGPGTDTIFAGEGTNPAVGGQEEGRGQQDNDIMWCVGGAPYVYGGGGNDELHISSCGLTQVRAWGGPGADKFYLSAQQNANRPFYAPDYNVAEGDTVIIN